MSDADRRRSFYAVVAIGVITLLALGFRVVLLDVAMRYDEANTYTRFAGANDTLFDYRLPNNHILHTLLVRASALVLGEAEWAVRWPAFFFGVALVPLTAWLGWRMFGRGTGVLASAVVAGNGWFIAHSTFARGYTMVACAAVVCLLAAEAARRHGRGGTFVTWATFAFAAAAGLATVPSMALFLAGAGLWLLASSFLGNTAAGPRRFVPRIIAAGVVGTLLGLAFYVPAVMISGFDLVFRNEWVAPQSLGQTVSRLTTELPLYLDSHGGFFPATFPGFGWLFLGLLGVGLVRQMVRADEHVHRVPLLLALIVGAVALMLYQSRVPQLRGLSYMVPVAACVASYGGLWAVHRLRLPNSDWLTPVAGVSLALGLLLLHAARHDLRTTWRNNEYNVAVRDVLAELRPWLNDPANNAGFAAAQPGWYYQRLYGVELNPPAGRPPKVIVGVTGLQSKVDVEWREMLEREGFDATLYPRRHLWRKPSEQASIWVATRRDLIDPPLPGDFRLPE
jgi:hypothetical protein